MPYNGLKKVIRTYTDLYVVFGKKSRPGSKNIFFVGWQINESEKPNIFKNFRNKERATLIFNRVSRGKIEPPKQLLKSDPLKNRLYDWEDEYAVSYARPVTKSEARALINRVSEDYGMDSPELKWIETGEDSTYFLAEHIIELAHHNEAIILHEMAHAITDWNAERLDRESTHHSPSYAWTLIELYHRYLGLDLQTLVQSANKYGILGDDNTERVHNLNQHYYFTPNSDLWRDSRRLAQLENP